MQEYQINDIADDLLILNRHTIDVLCSLPNCSDCLALYIFYYKTAKWQKTDTVKANDKYIGKCLKWGTKKIRETKKTLKENGLIDIIQRRTDGRIDGWYIKVSYLVSKKEQEQIKVSVESNNAPKQQVAETTSGFQETNALKEYIKCLKKEIEMLKEKIYIGQTSSDQDIKSSKKEQEKVLLSHFELIWEKYPNKKGKVKAREYFMQWVKGRKIGGTTIKLTDEQMWYATAAYIEECENEKRDLQFIKHGDTFFNKAILDYVDDLDE